ncbi:alcohol dehydrogenase catalytic domain-containing protein [Lachnospiraceae bacterium ZAX-1]
MMLAYVYRSEDKAFELREKEKPVLGLDTKAVVRVLACSICGTDIRTFQLGSEKIEDGQTVGHEIVGQITELAEEYEGGFGVGDYISIAPAIGCGTCVSCRAGATNMCDDLNTIGFQYEGGFAEYMAIPKQAFAMGNVYRLPLMKEVADYTVFALSEPLACVLNAQSYLAISEGDDVVVIGGGTIGCMHAELAKNAKANKVIIAETSQSRIKQAEELLSDRDIILVNSRESDLKGAVNEITDGKGADVVVIACSVGQAQAEGMNLLAKRGRISLFGGLVGESCGFIDSNLIHYKEVSVFGVHASTAEQNKAAMKLIRDGIIDANKYITRRYPLDSIEEAFKEAVKGEAMKIIISEKRQ